MDERDVVAELELPETTRVTRHAVKPDDVIVIECDAVLSVEHAARIQEYAEQVWPNNKVAVLSHGMHVKVMAPEE